jgi:hypothetical protein
MNVGLIRWSGKVLEISGKIMQADGVDAWIESQGKALFEQWVTKRGIKYFSTYRGKKQVVEALRQPLRSRAFSESIDKTFGEYLIDAEKVCEAVEKAGSFGGFGFTFIVPSFLFQDHPFRRLEARIKNWDEFNRLYAAEVQDLFFDEWRRAAVQQIRDERPAPDKPFSLGNDRFIVSVDDEAFWSDRLSRGSYYIYESPNSKMSKADFSKITRQVADLDRIRGAFSKDQLARQIQSFEKIASIINEKNDWHQANMALIGSRMPMLLCSRD